MLFTFLTIVTRWSRSRFTSRPIFMLWLVQIWQVSSWGKFMQHIATCLLWQSFVSTCDVFNRLFPLDVQNEIQLPSRVFCYSWLVCLLYFWLRNAQLVKVGWHCFCFSPCWMRKRIGLVTLLDAILTSRQTRAKLQCLYENLISNNFRKMAVLKKIWFVT